VTLVLPFSVLCYQLAAGSLSAGSRRLVVATLAASAALMALTSTDFLPDAWAKLAQVYGAYTLTFLIQAGMLATLLVARIPTAAPHLQPFRQAA
jgi:hypothetical protein